MKNIIKLFGKLLIISILISSCSDIEPNINPNDALSKGCEIHDFYLPGIELSGKVEKDGYIALSTLRGYDTAPLMSQKPTFWISGGASVSPDSTIAQNFTDTVEYVVTSESGVAKTWKVYHKFKEFTDAGFGETEFLWFKSHVELALPAVSFENSIAVIGDYFVLSRNGLIFNRFTGQPTGKTINKTGIDLGTGTEPNTPFLFVNDDAGNLIGSLLGNWTSPYFRVYKWDAIDQPPKLLLNYQAEVEAIGGLDGTTAVQPIYGRKIVARGDITKNGLIGSYNFLTNKKHTYHDFWSISNEQFDGTKYRLKTGYPAKGDNNYYQLAYPIELNKMTPFYFSDYNTNLSSGAWQTTLKYVYGEGDDQSNITILGPLVGGKGDNGTGWGQRIYHSLVFNFFNKRYIAVLHAISTSYYVTVLDPGDNPEDPDSYKAVYHAAHPIKGLDGNDATWDINGNGTAGLAVKEWKDKDGVSRINLYAFMSTTGVYCYEFNNYKAD